MTVDYGETGTILLPMSGGGNSWTLTSSQSYLPKLRVYSSAFGEVTRCPVTNLDVTDLIVAGQANWIPGVAGGGAVAQLDAWTQLYAATASGTSGNTGTSIPTFTVSSGTDRILLVSVAMENSTSANTATISATYGGVPMHPIGIGTGQRAHQWMGYLLDSEIPSGANRVVASYSGGSNTYSGIQVKWASYSGVHQTIPVNDSASNSAAAASVTFGSTIDYVSGGMTVVAGSNGGNTAAMSVGGTPSFAITAAATSTNGGGMSSAIGVTAEHTGTGSYASSTNVSFSGTTSTRSAVVAVSLAPAAGTPSPATLDILAANMDGATAVHADYNGQIYDLTNIGGTKWQLSSATDAYDTYVNSITIYSDGDLTGQIYPVVNDGGALSWPTIAVTLASWDGSNNVDVWATSDWNDQDQLFVDYDGSGPVAMAWNLDHWEHTFTGYGSFVAGDATVTSYAAFNSPQSQAVIDSTAMTYYDYIDTFDIYSSNASAPNPMSDSGISWEPASQMVIEVGTGTGRSSATGPCQTINTGKCADGSDNYLMIEASSSAISGVDPLVAVLSQVIDPTNGTPTISFLYSMYVTGSPTAQVQATPDGSTWDTIATLSDRTEAWTATGDIPITGYTNSSTFRIRVIYTGHDGQYTNDFAIDDLRIFNQ